MTGVLEIISSVIWTIITEGIKTISHLFDLLLKLFKAISPFSASGPLGFIISVLIIGGVIFILGKYVLHMGKISLILIGFGIIIFIAVTSSLI